MSWVLTGEEIVKATGAKASSSVAIKGIATDSRGDLQERLFVALKGERYDAHDFVVSAVQNGASAVLTHQDRPEYAALKTKAAFFLVPDTLSALQSLATYWRRKHRFQVVAISGSNGKTSSKEFTQQLLKDYKPTVASQASLNNHWGVPISILSADDQCKILILEMGMNHQGELTRLARIAEPDVVVVTMVGQSHVGELGSQENIARAKEELYLAAPKAIAIFNLDNSWTRDMYARAQKAGTYARLISFSSHVSGADVQMRAEKMSLDGLSITGKIGSVTGRCWLKVFGRHNVNNLMVAAAVAQAVGMPAETVWKKLELVSLSAWGRNQWLQLPSGSHILFDAYNANPESMTALLKNLYELEMPGAKILVLGEMLELGDESSRAHKDLGDMVGKIGADMFWFIGPHFKDVEAGLRTSGTTIPAFFSAEFDPAISMKVKNALRAQDLVALKASRGQKLETVLEHWGIQT